MTDTTYRYDVFISYSHRDTGWVFDWLVPRLKEAGLAVWTDVECLGAGMPYLVAI